jgi:hypothetical protein
MKSLKLKIAELEKRLADQIGPHGGKIIGKTRNGKPIYDSHDHAAHKDYTPEDHKDAEHAHQWLAHENKRKPTLNNYHWQQSEAHHAKAQNAKPIL